MEEIIGFFPTNQNTLYLLCLFYSDNEIITVHGRPEIYTLIGWIETSCLFLSFNKVSLGSCATLSLKEISYIYIFPMKPYNVNALLKYFFDRV